MCCVRVVASFPVPRPVFCRLQYVNAGPYCKRRKAGRGTGNEAIRVACVNITESAKLNVQNFLKLLQLST